MFSTVIVNINIDKDARYPVRSATIALTMLLNATPGLSPLHLDFPRLTTKH
jgi:hypothetical protein